METTGEALRALAPGGEGGVALLSGGHADPLWFEHVLLARELSIGLVEPRRSDHSRRPRLPEDAARPGTDQRAVPPPARRADGSAGAARHRRRPACWTRCARGRCISSTIPAPRWRNPRPWPPSCRALARQMLGEDLITPSQATLWLGDGANLRTVLRDLEGWVIRNATDGGSVPVVPEHLSPEKRAELAAQVAAKPAHYAALMAPTPSVAPCATPTGLEPRPVVLRMFLAHRRHHVAGDAGRARAGADG